MSAAPSPLLPGFDPHAIAKAETAKAAKPAKPANPAAPSAEIRSLPRVFEPRTLAGGLLSAANPPAKAESPDGLAAGLADFSNGPAKPGASKSQAVSIPYEPAEDGLAGLAGLAGVADSQIAPATPDDADAVEELARELLAIAERHPATRIPDRSAAMPYFRSEARRRLELIGRRALDATTGEDIERAALMAEEHATMAAPDAHSAAVAGLLLAGSPLHGVPGAVACRGCGRGIWCSPSWQGSPPDICFACSRGVTP